MNTHTPECINHDDETACTCGTYRTHTSGPWEARKNASEGYAVRDNLDRLIAEIPFQRGDVRLGAPGEAQAANAHLIAAAPELLEALETLLAEVDSHQEDCPQTVAPDDVLERVRAAIAKAKGE